MIPRPAFPDPTRSSRERGADTVYTGRPPVGLVHRDVRSHTKRPRPPAGLVRPHRPPCAGAERRRRQGLPRLWLARVDVPDRPRLPPVTLGLPRRVGRRHGAPARRRTPDLPTQGRERTRRGQVRRGRGAHAYGPGRFLPLRHRPARGAPRGSELAPGRTPPRRGDPRPRHGRRLRPARHGPPRGGQRHRRHRHVHGRRQQTRHAVAAVRRRGGRKGRLPGRGGVLPRPARRHRGQRGQPGPLRLARAVGHLRHADRVLPHARHPGRPRTLPARVGPVLAPPVSPARRGTTSAS